MNTEYRLDFLTYKHLIKIQQEINVDYYELSLKTWLQDLNKDDHATM